MDLPIPGCRLFRLASHEDERGSVAEVFRQEWFPGLPDFVQGNLGRSRDGVLRGMHYHRRQSDLWVPIGGAMAIGLYDMRPGTPADPPGIRVDAEPGVALYIPRGVAHGYVAVGELTLLYLVDRTYDGGADEHGFMPLDPAIGFDWPVPDPTLSERDRRAPSIAEALASDPVDPFVG